MKRTSKIFAILLTLCLTFGIIAAFSSAATTEGYSDLGFSQNHESLADGTTPSYSVNGTGSDAPSSSTVVTANANKYLRFSYVKDYTGSKETYRRDLIFGHHYAYASSEANAIKAINNGTIKGLSGYSYFTQDFDLSADQYRYLLDEEVDTGTTDENGNPIMETVTNEYLGTTVPEGAYGVRLSYSDKTYWQFDARPIFYFEETVNGEQVNAYYYGGDTTAGGTKIGSSYVAITLSLKYDSTNGVWKLYRSKSNHTSEYYVATLSNNIGEWNHFTYTVEVNHEKLSDSVVRFYFEGKYVCESKIWTGSYTSKIVDILPRGIDWSISSINQSVAPNNVKYSIGFDNWTSRYYDKDYSSGEKVGIDDFYADDSTVSSITECEDVVYNVDYQSPAPNKYADIGGKKVYLKDRINDALAGVKSGTTIVTTLDLLDINPPAWTALTIKCDPETKVTLSNEALARGVTLTKTLTGYEISSGIKANMSLFTDMKFNLYLPKIEGVEITSVTGATLASGTMTVQGVEMYVVSATPSIDSFEAINTVISYTLNGKEMEYKATLDPMNYATIVARSYECGSKEATLIYQMVSYKEDIARLLNSDFVDESGKLSTFMALFDSHTDCKCKSTSVNISEAEKSVNYSALIEKGVTGIAYKLTLSEIGVIINVSGDTVVSSVSYENALGEKIVHTEENGNLVKKNGYYFVSGVSAAYIDEIMTITVDGAEGTYSLGKYITNNPDVAVAKSIYKYAVAAERYKNSSWSDITVSVDYLREDAIVGAEYIVEGYYVGVGDEGSATNVVNELYLKDKYSDKLIAVQGVPYGSGLNFGYNKGDLVRLTVNLALSDNEHQTKRYAVFAEGKNPENIEDTIVSSGNDVEFKLDNVIVVENWADMQEVFKAKELETYTYIHIKGAGYINRYSKTDLYRPHMNDNCKDLTTMKPDSVRALGFRGTTLKANISDKAWAAYKTNLAGYPAITTEVHKMDLDVYCVLTKTTSLNFILTPLDDEWFVNHDHVFEGEWITDSEATIFSEGKEYRKCTKCSINEWRTIDMLAPERIEVVSLPKTSYTVGELLSTDGLKVMAYDKNGVATDVTALISIDKVLIDTSTEKINVYYAGLETSYDISVNLPLKSIFSVKHDGVANELYYVEGLVAGYAQDGPDSTIQVLLKDLETDDLIAFTGITGGYSSYKKGDLVRVYVTYKEATSTHNPGRPYLSYAAENVNLEKTIISRGNVINYKLDNVVTLSSFDEWKALFKVGEIDHYTFVRIVEPIYGSTYKTGDGVYARRIHTIPTSVNAAHNDTKPDKSRSVSLRENMMDLNLGTSWTNFFAGKVSSDPYSLTYKGDELIAVYTGANSAYFQLAVLENDWLVVEPEGDYSYADIVTEVATAYVNRGNYIQYNQYVYRRQINPSPEDATAENTIYLDCSSFANAVYYEAFGVNIMPYDVTEKVDGVTQTPQTGRIRNYARDNQDNPDVIGYWLVSSYTDKQAMLDEIQGNLVAGDVLNYRKKGDSAGHVMIYIGDGKFIHSTGDDFKDPSGNDYKDDNNDASQTYDGANSTEQKTGTVRLETSYINALFVDSTNARYLANAYDVCIIRPFERGLTPTAETIQRMEMREICIEKKVDAGVSSAVNRGDSIKYTLTLKNSAPYTRELVINEVLSDYVSFVSGTDGISVVGNNLSLTMKLGAFATATVEWTVKVNENAPAGAIIDSTNTTVNGVGLAKVVNTVSAYTAEELTAIADKAKEYAANGVTFDDPALMAKTLYKEVLGVDIYDFDNALELLSDILNYDVYLTNGYNVNSESALYEIAAPYLCGGRDTPSLYLRHNETIRLITQKNISVGDVILAYDESEGKTISYVYVGDSTLIAINSADKTCTSVTMTDSPYESSHVLVTLFAYDKYAILRPSMK